MRITTTVNGTETSVEIDGHEAAIDVVRERFGLTGSKLSCAGGVCGACTMQIDETPVVGCLTPAVAMDQATVTTIEGIADGSTLHPVQRAFLAHDGLQCGFCTPGFVVDAAAFVDRWRSDHHAEEPDHDTIADALAGHLCRCGAYAGIYRAVAAACRGDFDDDEHVVQRVDGPAKVTGAARYTVDQYPDGALEAVIIRSPVAAGVVAEFALDDRTIDLLDEQRHVRYVGQPIAAVAAETLADARRAAAAFPLEIKPLPFVIDPDEAVADGAPQVYEGRAARRNAISSAENMAFPGRWHVNNTRGPLSLGLFPGKARRRVDRARDDNDPGLVELTFQTSTQLHCSLEPHCTVADFTDPERLEVWNSSQAVSFIAHELAEHYHLHDDQVTVHADFVGGGFGSKLAISIISSDILAACDLSKKSGRPVRLILDRREELTAAGNRAATRSHMALLVDDDGDLEAMVFEGESQGGASISGAYGLWPMQVYGKTPRSSKDIDVLTNAPPGCAFRGPGGVVSNVALESAVDEVAHRRGEDPITLRRRWDGNDRRQRLYEWAAGLDVWTSRPTAGSQTGRFRRGVGVAMGNWGYSSDPTTEVEVGVDGGRLYVTTATQDPGTGGKTLLARAVAEVFDVRPIDVDVRAGTADGLIPHGPTSGGSRAAASIWPTALEAAQHLRDSLGTTAVSSAHDGRAERAVRGGDLDHIPMPRMSDLRMGRGMSGAVHVVEVEVDTSTGKSRVLSVHGGFTIGKPHAPVLAQSQAEGAIVQAIGFALYENQILDPHTGTTLTSNMEDYRIPQLGDTPEITIHFDENGWDHVPGGGVGIGELCTTNTASAIANAVFNATGWRPLETPIRPDRVLEALR